jgi:hypothetical protein
MMSIMQMQARIWYSFAKTVDIGSSSRNLYDTHHVKRRVMMLLEFQSIPVALRLSRSRKSVLLVGEAMEMTEVQLPERRIAALEPAAVKMSEPVNRT